MTPTHAALLAYDQTRQHDEFEEAKALAGAGKPPATSALGRGRKGRGRKGRRG